MSSKRGGGRGLLPEDRALWDRVKKTITPLKAEQDSGAAVPDPVAVSAPISPGRPKSFTRPVRSTVSESPKPPPLAKLDRRARSRVARGRIEIDARIDLHGMTLERARTRLRSFLMQAQARELSLVLVITGKGLSGRGALRHEVPHWLSQPEARSLVIGFEEAAAPHGGAGALYVRIRRARS